MEIDITLTTRIGIPDDSVVEIAPTGAIVGFRMPCGRLVRPWVTLEIEEDGENRDLTYDEQTALGIDTEACDLERVITKV